MSSKDYVFKSCGEAGGDLLAGVHWAASTAESEAGKPLVLVLHGGGFVIGSKDMVPKSEIEALTNLGFVVVIPNYRLCPQLSVFNGPLTDAKDALIWCRTKLPGLLTEEGVSVDPSRVAAMGHSAGGGMALSLGAVENPVSAILDLYGGKYYSDKYWALPSAFAAGLPEFPWPYCDQIYNEPILSSAPPFSPAHAPPNTLPPPRNAWMLNCLKNGTWIEKIIQDGNYDRVDGTKGFRAGFPPTAFVHGTGDHAVDYSLSVRAAEELKGLGVEVEVLLPDGMDHMFDLMLKGDEPVFRDYLAKGFEFLKKHV